MILVYQIISRLRRLNGIPREMNTFRLANNLSFLLSFIPFHSIPFHSIPFHSIPFHTISLHSNGFPFHCLRFHSIPFDLVPFHCHFTPRCSGVLGSRNSGVGCFQDTDVPVSRPRASNRPRRDARSVNNPRGFPNPNAC